MSDSNNSVNKKIAIICTSADKLGDHSTGVWLEECAAPYYIFEEKGYDVDILSPAGGVVPIDAASLGEGFYTEACKKFKEEDAKAWNKLQTSQKLDTTTISSYEAIFFAGGHGTCTDFIGLNKTVEAFYATGKPLAAVCHGPMCLMEAKKSNGEPLVQGLTVAGFTEEEEAAVGLTDKVPYTPESQMIKLGAKVEKADPWTPKACRDGNLITGQNPQSSEATAKLVVEALS